ncbi:hypothetical protein SteCoe_1241 [Stentor coeruleus]|uniref:Kinesin motor domain-containing protein n=1 Tax=Stentor coeruleus TaxID=5963 RepID=A0A1R2D238_9CILI|nr:hypothetical protein SteCoe_1241 [Stentor coeruleus]
MFGLDLENSTQFSKTVNFSAFPQRFLHENSDISGLIPRSISDIFANLSSNQAIRISFLQIYNEKILDLLQDLPTLQPLSIRESSLFGIFVEGLAEFKAKNETECCFLLAKGEANRIVRQTKLNQKSSRSHTIFQIVIDTDETSKKGFLKRTKINFCDLAGSEKYDKEINMSNERIREITQINKSLSILGKVVYALGKKNHTHVPYRDSKLTRLLQDSLGLSTRTILIATVSPSILCVEETISTLKFADRAKKVMIKDKNLETGLKNPHIFKLQGEIQHLKQLLSLKNPENIVTLKTQLEALKEENQKIKQFTQDEVQKLKNENQKLKSVLQEMGQSKDIENNSIKNEGEIPRSPKTVTHKNEMLASLDLGNLRTSYSPSPYEMTSPSPDIFRLAVSPDFSKSDIREVKSFRIKDNFKRFGVRYRIKGKDIEFNEIVEDAKEKEYVQKQMRIIRSKLNYIAELERKKKQKFKEEIDKITEARKKAQDDKKKKVGKSNRNEGLQEIYMKKRKKYAELIDKND